MTTPAEIRPLVGSDVTLVLAPAAGGGTASGRLVGTLDSDDGMVLFLEPPGAPGRRLSWNYQHVAEIHPAGRLSG